MSKVKKKEGSLSVPLVCSINGKFFELDIGKKVEEPNFCVCLFSNGLYKVDSNVGHDIIEKVDEEILSRFDSTKDSVSHRYPIISYKVYSTVLEFLRKVYKEHHSEGNVLLVLSRKEPLDKQEYEIVVPKQKVSGASVDYDDGLKDIYKEIGPDKFLAGSIHSHPNFAASQSGIDHDDEIKFPGVHVTLGNIMKNPVEIHERVCLSGNIYPVEKPIINTSPPVEAQEFPKEWLDRVEKKDYSIQTWVGNQRTIGYQRNERGPTVKELLKMMEPTHPVNQRNAKTLKPIISD